VDRDHLLGEHLRKLLDLEDAHTNFDRAIEKTNPKKRGIVPEGMAHSLWQLLEHLRICQLDLLDFCRNPKYQELSMEAYWPSSAAPSSLKAWDQSVASFRRDRLMSSQRRRVRSTDPTTRPNFERRRG
jgi:hypothetical protein